LAEHEIVYTASTSYDTKTEILDVTIDDRTGYYPNTELYPTVTEEVFSKIARFSYENLNGTREKNCKAKIFQFKDIWSVTFTLPDASEPIRELCLRVDNNEIKTVVCE